MTQKKIPAEIYNFLSNAEYHLAAASALDERAHMADRIYLLLIALENASFADTIHHHWVHDKKIPDAYFRKHGLKLQGVRHPVIRIQFDKKKKKAKEIVYLSEKQLEKLLNICRYGPGRGAQSVPDYFSESRWFDDELRKEVVNKLRWTRLGVELSEKFLKGEL